ncbi:hypothetical protein FOL01_0141 [Weissella jogaejeotgali]|uniref:Uncharacterized protein n=1 Tax=Weissella jogaejeotgali TaxID=1631871 RepID=A0A1L6R917_9LACO|nr:hypothetical protein [Weissella jogaejeotgali]APS41000.1 hypothetical protein FOL01_0141 [Weissella jogaejeotgali]
MKKIEAINYLEGNTSIEFQKNLKKLLTTPYEEISFRSNFKKLRESAKKLSDAAVPYSEIATLVYAFQSQPENVDGVGPFLDKFKDILLKEIDSDSNETVPADLNILIKTYENISLSDAQYRSLLGEEKIKSLKDGIDDLTNNLDNRMNNIYSGFVSVLGIFVAISFSLFGGVNLLENLFKDMAGGSTPENIGISIMLSGFFIALLYILILGLTSGLSRITQKENHFWEDFSFRTLFIIMSISCGIIIFGFMYHIGTVDWKVPFLNNYIFKWNAINVLIIYLFVCFMLYRRAAAFKNIVVNPQYWSVSGQRDVPGNSKFSLIDLIYIGLFLLIFIVVFALF